MYREKLENHFHVSKKNKDTLVPGLVCKMTSVVKSLLALDKEQELLQSFILRSVGGSDEVHTQEPAMRHSGALPPTTSSVERRERARVKVKKKVSKASTNEGKVANAGATTASRMEADIMANSRRNEENAQSMKRRKAKEFFVDFYTDKDRAAAVSAGAYDIKQSLQIKQKQDRSGAPLMVDEVDIGSIIALGLKEIKNRNPENAIHFFSKVGVSNHLHIYSFIPFRRKRRWL